MLRVGREAVERGQHERRRLAGAGLGDAEQIAAGQNRRDRLALDRRRLRIILRAQARRAGASRAREYEKTMKYSNMKTAAQNGAVRGGQKSAPRELGEQVGRDAGRVLELVETVHAACKKRLVLQCNIEESC